MFKKTIASLVLVTLAIFSVQTFAFAKPKLNAPRVKGEPHWEGDFRLRGAEKTHQQATPILEREYRPFHIYGNMQRRHHFRGTVIPSHRDRTDMLKAYMSRNQGLNRYRS